MWVKKILKFEQTEDLNFCFEIRRKVFILEQNINPHEEYDEYERSSKHYLVFKKLNPIGTCRIRTTELGIKIERVAVLKEFRKQNIGRFLMDKIFEEFKNQELKIFYLYSQIEKIGFYEKFGFKTEGEIFFDANIPHKLMKLTQKI